MDRDDDPEAQAWGWFGGKTAGAEIRNLRRARGLTQQELADRVGMSRNHLSNVENGADASLAMYRRIAAALGTSARDLVSEMTVEEAAIYERDGNNKAFGDYVRRLRRARGWTQATLASGVDVSRDWISSIETGRPCSQGLAARLLTHLGVPDADAVARDIASSSADQQRSGFERLAILVAGIERRRDAQITSLRHDADRARAESLGQLEAARRHLEELRRVDAPQGDVVSATSLVTALEILTSHPSADGDERARTADQLVDVIADRDFFPTEQLARSFIAALARDRAARIRRHISDIRELVVTAPWLHAMLNGLKILQASYDNIVTVALDERETVSALATSADDLAPAYNSAVEGVWFLAQAALRSWTTDTVLRRPLLTVEDAQPVWRDRLSFGLDARQPDGARELREAIASERTGRRAGETTPHNESEEG